MITPAAKISSDTWYRLARAHLLGARLGEETLTDLLVLEMLQFQNSNAFSIYHPTKREESWCGADLLVWIRRRNGLSRFLAIQAKKLYPNGHYKALNYHASTGIRQIDLLNTFAHQYRAIPLYLLYNFNHCDSADLNRYWHCCKALEVEQLGCTLVPSWKIDHAIKWRGQRTFTAVHANGPSRPWRCAFDCDNPERQLTELAMGSEQGLPTQVRNSGDAWVDALCPYPKCMQLNLPDFLFQTTEPLSTTVLDELRTKIDKQSGNTIRGKLSSNHDPLYPRKLFIVDYADTTDEDSADD